MRDLLRRVIPLQMRLAYRRRRAWAWHRETLAGIRVHYMDHLSMGHFESTGCGGGSTLLRAWALSSFGTGLVPYLLNRGMPKQGRTFEWCAGPGFIGFSLLGAGLTETLCLADINPQAVAACQRTINDNALAARANVYKSDNLANIPQSEQWDLVVGNPPWFPHDDFGKPLLTHDQDWRIHRTFFAQIGGHLKPGGIVVLLEGNHGSTSETFREMISSAGLEIVFVEFCSKRLTRAYHTYYLGIARRGDVVPDWARGPIFS